MFIIRSTTTEINYLPGEFYMKKFAFTLAELLVVVLIISVILVLFAPVLTKRAKENFNAQNVTQKEGKLFLYNLADSNCAPAADGQKSLDCNFIPDTNTKSIGVVMLSAGGGGAGASQTTVEYGKKLTVASTTAQSSKTQELTITKEMKNVVVKELIGSGAGGGGASWSQNSGSPQSQADCDPYNALFIPAAYNGTGGKNTCVTKYNVGDPNGPEMASSVKVVNAGGATCLANECCWKGTTSSDCTASGSWSGHSTSYSGCTRTVCTWHAANSSCQAWTPSGTNTGSWRLPTRTELQYWNYSSNKLYLNLGTAGLQFCDGKGSFYGSIYCSTLQNSCIGAVFNTCESEGVWTQTTSSSKEYYVYFLRKGKFEELDGLDALWAFSARCVLDGSNGGITSNSVHAGGGGGGGAYIKNYTIPEHIISSNIGGKIKLYSAAGGSGGNSASSSGSSANNGTSGGTSYVEVYAPDGTTLVWGLRASGGNYGKGATSASYGSGGAQKATDSCQIYENGIWTNTSCTGTGLSGNNGESITGANSDKTAKGGDGAGSFYNSQSAIGIALGGNSSNKNGVSATAYGAGGGGATITFDSSNNPQKGKGGSGANGVAEITYDLIYQAAAGGGGGGGAFAHIENISVTPGTTYTIRIGGGGSGGAVANNGGDGGESKVIFGDKTYSISGAKGGLTGTSATNTQQVVHGLGGLGAEVNSTLNSYATSAKNGYRGEDGTSVSLGSAGGCGGKSGIESAGGCGGLYDNGLNCSATTTFGSSAIFVQPENIFNKQYGSAAAGGGGGGWAYNYSLYPNNPSGGADGQNGYVYVYWSK